MKGTEGKRLKERGTKRERDARLEDRQTRGCPPPPPSHAAPACPTMQTNFLISMYCFHCSSVQAARVVAGGAASVRGEVGNAGSPF